MTLTLLNRFFDFSIFVLKLQLLDFVAEVTAKGPGTVWTGLGVILDLQGLGFH